MCDDPIEPDGLVIEDENKIEENEGLSYNAYTSDGQRILAVKCYYAQTTITAYNAIPSITESSDCIETDDEPYKMDKMN